MREEFVLLCYARNTPYSYDLHAPVPVFALGAYLEQGGIDVEYYDERLDPVSRFAELLARGPILAGFSVIGGFQIVASARLSLMARELSPKTKIVWGGITATTLTRETAAEPYIDFAVMGEGEETLRELARVLREGGDPSGLAGLAFRRGGEVVVNPRRPPPDLESLPFPYRGKAKALLPRYLERGSVRELCGYEASRGCPFTCGFCYSPGFHSDTRVKSRAKIEAELRELKSLGVSEIDVYDDTLLGARREEIMSFAGMCGTLGFKWIANLRVNMLTEGLLKRIEGSGCRWLYFGLESDDEDALRRMSKGFTAAEVEAGLELLRGSTLPTVFSLLVGLPTEGAGGGIERALAFAERLHERHPRAEIQLQSYVPLPGTALYPGALARGFRPPESLLGWAELDHFKTRIPWLERPELPQRIYIASFLAYRYLRHLSHWPYKAAAFPLHLLSLWRLRYRRFGIYFEKPLYEAALGLARLSASARFALRG